MRGFSGIGPGRLGLYALGVVALLTVGVLALAAGTRGFSGADADPTERANQPVGAEKSTPEPVAESATKTADETEPEKKADQIQRAVKEPEPVKEEPASASSSASAHRVCAGGRHHVLERSRDGHLGHTRGRGDHRGQSVCGGRTLRRVRLPVDPRLQHLHCGAPDRVPWHP